MYYAGSWPGHGNRAMNSMLCLCLYYKEFRKNRKSKIPFAFQNAWEAYDKLWLYSMLGPIRRLKIKEEKTTLKTFVKNSLLVGWLIEKTTNRPLSWHLLCCRFHIYSFIINLFLFFYWHKVVKSDSNVRWNKPHLANRIFSIFFPL